MKLHSSMYAMAFVALAMVQIPVDASTAPRTAGGEGVMSVVPSGVRGPAAGGAVLPASAFAASDAEIADFFDRYMRAKVKALDIPGAALVVLRNGRPILKRGYGVADLASRRPVDPDRTLFRAASISKTLPWILTMQLVEQGRLDLDRDVNSYLDFRIPYRFDRPITLRHLMTHTAGFAERFHGVFDQDIKAPLGVMLRDNIPDQAYAPGSTMAYSNYGAALAGYIVQRAYRQPWDVIVRTHVFEPAGMRASTVAQPPPPRFVGQLATTYEHGDPKPTPFRMTPLAPMGSLSATPADMGRLLAVLMRGGQGENGRVLGRRSVMRMTSLSRPLAPSLDDGLGLGLLVGQRHGVRYAGHAGNMTTLATDMEFLPEYGLGWYYVFNSQGPREAAREVRDELLASVIDDLVGPRQDDVRPIAGASTAADVAGDYISTRRMFSGPLLFSGLVNATTVAREGEGGLQIETAGRITHWRADGPDRFRERSSGEVLVATRGPDGRVQRIASSVLYPVAEFERQALRARLIGPVALVAAAMIAIAALAGLLAFAASVRRRLRGLPQRPERDVGGTINIDRAARWARRLLLATACAWVAFGVAIGIDFGVLFTIPSALRIGLGVLAWSTLPVAITLSAFAISQWRLADGSWRRRLQGLPLAIASACIAALFYGTDVVNCSTNW